MFSAILRDTALNRSAASSNILAAGWSLSLDGPVCGMGCTRLPIPFQPEGRQLTARTGSQGDAKSRVKRKTVGSDQRENNL